MRDISSRSIRNINITHKGRHLPPEPEQPPRQRRRRPRRRLWLLILGVVILAGVLGLLLSALFAGASVEVTPRTAQVTLPPGIEAQVDAPVGVLPFQTFAVTLSATTTVPAKGTQQVSKQASGLLTVQNTFSSATQRLIANTRFEAADGKIYRIHDSVVVPGGTAAKPGTVSVVAYADSPGADYNRTGNTTYTIPGFKGDPRYTKITATSGPMTGGFVGSQPAVATSDLTAAKNTMEQQLDGAVRASFNGNLPAGYVLVGGTLQVTYGALSQADAGGGNAAISEAATAAGDIVRPADLAAAVAKQTVQGYAGEAIAFADPGSVAISASTTPQAGSIQIVMSGQATLVWQFDPNALKTALVGKPKSDFEAIIRQFEPAIQKADASIRPFWTSTFPADPNKISISIAGQ